MKNKVQIKKLPSGVPGLDEILGGGFPEFSFNIIAGAPGCGKTTLAHQFIFANATPERPALYFTVLGERVLKMLRYQQQYTFFDETKLNTAVRFVNLSQELIDRGSNGVLEEIFNQVQATDAAIVVVDSFRAGLRNEQPGGVQIDVQDFVQQLALRLTSWQATTFLIGEYGEAELGNNPVFTVSDGLFWLYQNVERNSVVRKLQVMKLRGQMSVPGLHTFRITDAGLQAFSRTFGLSGKKKRAPDRKRLSLGSPALDEMMGGGIPEGDSLLVAGSSGTGKSLLATQFIMAGLSAGEPGIIAVFEERPDEYVGRALSFGLDLKASLKDGSLEVIYLRPLDLSVDEMMQELIDAVERNGAKRLVIDSLAGFEMALAPGFRTDFRESLYRMILGLTGMGITILSTLEMQETFDKLPFSSYMVSFLTDDIIRLRYVEIESQIRKLIMVVKMRGGLHSKDIREYDITSGGIVIGERLRDYVHLLTGIPERVNSSNLGEPPSKQSNKAGVIDGSGAENDGQPVQLDVLALNERLMLSLVRQHELTETAQLLNERLQTEINARKKAEEALIGSEKLASVGRMAAVLAHEINNPLESVTNILYIAQTSEGVPDEVRSYLETADAELRRIAHITRQTLGFYREAAAPATFRIAGLFNSIVDLLHAKIVSSRATVRLQCDAELQVTAFQGELRQVFSNLLRNSLDAVPEGGTVTLRGAACATAREGRHSIRISVSDNGHGISDAALSNIFQPFFTTKGMVGNGLGLWVSKQIIEKHGGTIQVRSRTKGLFQGTTFSVVIPLADVS